MTETQTKKRPPQWIAVVGDRLNRPFQHPLALVGLALTWALLGWLRVNPDARETIWAEDGRIFLQEGQQYGPLGALLVPYAGYMHLLPRIIGGLAWLFPVEAWAQALTAISCLVAGLVALLVYIVTARLPITAWARLLLASVSVLAPTLVTEVLGNAANMYTPALWGALWLFLFRPQRWWSAAVAGGIMILLSGTAIQMIALVPLLAIRPSRRSWPIAAGFTIGLILQIWAFTHSERGSKPSWPFPGALTDGYLHQVVMGSWIESAHVSAMLLLYLGWVLSFFAVAPYLVSIFVLWRARTERKLARSLAIALPLISAAYWCAFVSLNNLAVDYSGMSPIQLAVSGFSLRYAVFPSMVLWGLLILAIGWIRERDEMPRYWGKLRALVLVVLLACTTVSFLGFDPSLRSHGPEWLDSLAEARAECLSLPADAPVELWIAPFTSPWTTTLPCSAIVER